MMVQKIKAALEAAAIEDAAFEADVIVSHYTGKSRQWHMIHTEYQISPAIEAEITNCVERRIHHEPLQYILGTWYFYGDPYFVSKDCLIPRADTELIVEQAIHFLPPSGVFMDLCTGSGCIAIAILKNRPDCTAYAVDLSEAALVLARKNAVRNGVEKRLQVLCGDVLKEDFMPPILLDWIISNPPYIPEKDILMLAKEVQQEPHMALDGGSDGLIFYRKLLRDYLKYAKEGGGLLLEIGYNQAEEIRKLCAAFGYSLQIRKDYGNCDRCAIVQRGTLK